MNFTAVCVGYIIIIAIGLFFIATLMSILVDQITFAWCVMKGYRSLKIRNGQSLRVFYEAFKWATPNPGSEMRTKEGVFICSWNSFLDWDHA